MDSLLKDAIADAKTVRETALENAKLALTEAFTPTLQSMLSQKLREDDDELEDMEMDNADDEEAEEAPAMDADAAEEEMEPADDAADEEHGEDHDEDEAEEEGMREEEGEEEDEMREEEGEDEDDDLDLEAIIRELEEEAGDDEDEGEREMEESEDADEDKEEMDEQSDSSGLGKGDNKVDQASGDDYEKAETEKSSKAPGAEGEDNKVDDLKDHVELDLDSIIREIEGLDEEADDDKEEVEENNELEEVKKSLEEHREVIIHLRGKINEVNLLNAKLLYTNKLFRNHNLNDNQKLKVVETFDRAANLREVKLVFTTLAESFDGVRNVRKRSVNESVASKAVASTKPKQEIVEESNDVADRFKQLAGLIK